MLMKELEKILCLNILNILANKKNKNRVVISSKNYSFVVSKKYESIAKKVLNYYQHLSDKNEFNYSSVKRLALLITMIPLLLNYDNEKFLAKESIYNIESEEPEKNLREMFLFCEEERKSGKSIDEINNEIGEQTNKYKKYSDIMNDSEAILKRLVYEIGEERKLKEEQQARIEKEDQEYQEYQEYEENIKKYARFYNLDEEKVLMLARRTSNNFKNFDKIINTELYDLKSIEATSVIFVNLLYRDDLLISLEDLGYKNKKDDLIIDDTIETREYDSMEDLILDNEHKYSEYVGVIADLFDIGDQKELILSVSFTEIGKDGSPVSRAYNNYSGLTDKNGNLIRFPRPEAGVISMVSNFKLRFSKYDMEELEKLAIFHLTGKTKIVAENDEERKEIEDRVNRWVNNVTFFYKDIENNPENYFHEKDHILAIRK